MRSWPSRITASAQNARPGSKYVAKGRPRVRPRVLSGAARRLTGGGGELEEVLIWPQSREEEFYDGASRVVR